MDRSPENRAFPRMSVDCGIAYRPVDTVEMRNGVARNISGNGVLFVAAERPAIGARMEITVNPGVLSIPALNALIEVVRVSESSDAGDGPEAPPGGYEIGARIMAMR